jgi:hypothetical protein
MFRIFLLLIIPVTALIAQPKIAFRIAERDLIPEGITYDAATKKFFLGSIHQSKILTITLDGKVNDFVQRGSYGLKQVLGMKVQDGVLWVCNNSASYDTVSKDPGAKIHLFDSKTGKFLKVYSVNDGNKHLFNDLVFAPNGDVYISDSEGGSIFRIKKNSNELEQFLPANTLRYPNGVIVSNDGKKLLVSTGTAEGVLSIDFESKEIKPVQHHKFMFFGIDGLYRYKEAWIGIQNVVYPESIVKIEPSADETSILKISTLVADHPQFDSPTTGVIVGDEFYFIANSQLMQIVGNKGVIKKPTELKETLIMKISLK